MKYNPWKVEIKYKGNTLNVSTYIEPDSGGVEIFRVEWPDGSFDLMYRELTRTMEQKWFAKDPIKHPDDLKEIGLMISQIK